MAELELPVTVVAGAQDEAAPIAALEAPQQGQFPNARLEVVDGPHIACREAPGAFAKAVPDHVDWVRGTS